MAIVMNDVAVFALGDADFSCGRDAMASNSSASFLRLFTVMMTGWFSFAIVCIAGNRCASYAMIRC